MYCICFILITYLLVTFLFVEYLLVSKTMVWYNFDNSFSSSQLYIPFGNDKLKLYWDINYSFSWVTSLFGTKFFSEPSPQMSLSTQEEININKYTYKPSINFDKKVIYIYFEKNIENYNSSINELVSIFWIRNCWNWESKTLLYCKRIDNQILEVSSTSNELNTGISYKLFDSRLLDHVGRPTINEAIIHTSVIIPFSRYGFFKKVFYM